MLLPASFCCGRVFAYVRSRLEPYGVLSLCIWKSNKLFLLCSEFLGCFSHKIAPKKQYSCGRVVPGGAECPGFARISASAEKFCSWWAVNRACKPLIHGDQPGRVMLSLAESQPASWYTQQADLPSRKHPFWSAGWWFFCYWYLGLLLRFLTTVLFVTGLFLAYDPLAYGILRDVLYLTFRLHLTLSVELRNFFNGC